MEMGLNSLKVITFKWIYTLCLNQLELKLYYY